MANCIAISMLAWKGICADIDIERGDIEVDRDRYIDVDNTGMCIDIGIGTEKHL